jgi:carbamoyl-phosphate synthase/aspartate carbamoyltransferase/dihydroorotase
MRDLVQRHRSGSQVCRHNVLATIFFEASTRTSCSFQVAMLRLGGQVVHVDASGNTATTTANRAGGNSSVVKGESLSDTLRCLECYVDITVVRHYQTGALLEVAPHINKPMINAGDGIGEHPTQALLDAFTILDEIPLSTNNSNNNKKNSSNKLVVIMLGDLKHGRTVHSLAKLLAQIMPGMNMTIDLRYVAPPGLEMPSYLQEQLQQQSSSILQSNASSLNETVLQNVDIIYVTRVQKERFESMEDYERAKVSVKCHLKTTAALCCNILLCPTHTRTHI